MTEITADDLVIYKDGDKGVYSGGYSIDSILLKAGLPAITSVHYGGGGDKDATTVATTQSLFQDLVIPNWAFTGGANNPFVAAFGIGGGAAAAARTQLAPNIINDIISDDSAQGETLYDKLLELASSASEKPPPNVPEKAPSVEKPRKKSAASAKTRKHKNKLAVVAAVAAAPASSAKTRKKRHMR